MRKKSEPEEVTIPKYIRLCEMYKCENCKYNNSIQCHRGSPCKRTECKKRMWLAETLSSWITATALLSAFFLIYNNVYKIGLTLAYIILIAVGLDIVCCFIEEIVDKLFENVEKHRRDNYLKKVEKLNRIKELSMEKAEQDEIKKCTYENLDVDTDLIGSLHEKLKYLEEEEIVKSYKELIFHARCLLVQCNKENSQMSNPDIKYLFSVYLPRFEEYVEIYINGDKTERETEELLNVVQSLDNKISSIQNADDNNKVQPLSSSLKTLRRIVDEL